MAKQKMNISEVKNYYGKRYSQILKAIELKESLKDSIFDVDLSCGCYLELETKTKEGIYLKINHGINNAFPYNSWYKDTRYYYCELERKHHKSQRELVTWIKETIK